MCPGRPTCPPPCAAVPWAELAVLLCEPQSLLAKEHLKLKCVWANGKPNCLNCLLSPFVIGESTVPLLRGGGLSFSPRWATGPCFGYAVLRSPYQPCCDWNSPCCSYMLPVSACPRGYPREVWGRARALCFSAWFRWSRRGVEWFFGLGGLFFSSHLFAHGFDLAVAYNGTLGKEEASSMAAIHQAGKQTLGFDTTALSGRSHGNGFLRFSQMLAACHGWVWSGGHSQCCAAPRRIREVSLPRRSRGQQHHQD